MKVSIAKLLLPLIALTPLSLKAYNSISGGKLYAENAVLENGSIEFKDGTITSLSKKAINKPDTLQIPSNWYVIPGMIDMHVHGAAGFDVMDATPEALQSIAKALAKEGTTSFLATTMSNPEQQIEKTIDAVVTYQNDKDFQRGAEIIGIHLEGPFLSKQKAGAQPADSIIPVNLELVKKWETLSNGSIKMMTLAPENDPDFNLTHYLKSKGIIASIGHTNANFATAQAAIDAGCSHGTHLFNAMPAIHHRDPGAAMALLLNDKATVELIPDFVHNDPSMLALTHRLKGIDKIILVTDSMRAKCMPDGQYTLAGQETEVCCGACKLPDGTLAGSTLKLNDGIRNMQTALQDVPFKEVIKFATENPAKKLNIWNKKGSLAPGKDADIVVLDENYEVRYTFCKGSHSMNRNKAEVIVVDNSDELGRVTADKVIYSLKATYADGEKFVLGLAAGSTPVPFYRSLVERYKKDDSIDFSNTVTFNLDEYVGLAPENPQSYNYYMNEHLFGNGLLYTVKNKRGFKKTNIFIPNGSMLKDISPASKERRLADRIQRYNKSLAAKGPIDLQILGIGHNGHIGFAEPGSSIDGEISVVELAESTRKANARFFDNDISKVPTEAISMGIGTIMKAKQIIVIASGKDKAEIVKAALQGPISPDVPVTALQDHENVTFILDKEAASLLQ